MKSFCLVVLLVGVALCQDDDVVDNVCTDCLEDIPIQDEDLIVDGKYFKMKFLF